MVIFVADGNGSFSEFNDVIEITYENTLKLLIIIIITDDEFV